MSVFVSDLAAFHAVLRGRSVCNLLANRTASACSTSIALLTTTPRIPKLQVPPRAMLPKQIAASAIDSQYAPGCSSLLSSSQCIAGPVEGNDLLVRQAKDLIVAAAASVLLGENMTSPAGASAQVLFSPANSFLAHQHCNCSMAETLARSMPQSSSFSV